MSGIMIMINSEDYSEDQSLFRELVSLARQLQKETYDPLTIAVIGQESSPHTQAVAMYGAETVRVISEAPQHALWPEYDAEVLAQLCSEVGVSTILLSKTLWGTEVAVRLAAALDGSAAMDITATNLVNGSLEISRATFGGAAETKLRMIRMPAVLVPHPKIWSAAEAVSAPCPIMPFTPQLDPGTLKTTPEGRHQLAQGPDITQARILVSGGRGLGGPEPFKLLADLASLMGGQVAASRPPVDSGWVSGQMQVGLTGKTVAPDLYFAVGISGAIQHITGCYNARNIVAVNSDPHAPIFQYATFGVVGDWQDVLPSFYKALAANNSSSGQKTH